MVEAVMLWNEPNNLSHWDFHQDPEWKIFSRMVIAAAKAIRAVNPKLKIALGGISPVDPNFGPSYASACFIRTAIFW